MSILMNYIHHIPEVIAISLLGLFSMSFMTIPSVIIGVKKIRNVGLASVWDSSSLQSIALRSTGAATRNLFFAYALIYPFYLNEPNHFTLIGYLIVVMVVAMNAVFQFTKARKIEENKISLTGKAKINHEKYVQKLIKTVSTFRKLSSVIRLN